MKVLKNKKRFLVVAVVAIMMLVMSMTGCTYGFPEGFDKDECIKKAEEIIDIVNTRDYDAIHALIREDLQENVTAADFKEAWDAKLEKLGAFVKFGNPVLSGETDIDTGDDFAMVVYYCYYEDGEVTFTIYLDVDLQMTSISMKLD